MLILSSFLSNRFARDRVLPLQASLAFEQSYSEVDGDSASSSELYSLMSATAGLPLRQDLAVTGAVDQFGNIQAVGGINEKIEGFFDVCRSRGLAGSHGVVMPYTNVDALMLRADVRRAVDDGLFHIYGVKTIDEGMELLTGLPAGKLGRDGKWSSGSFNARVQAASEKLWRQYAAFQRKIK